MISKANLTMQHAINRITISENVVIPRKQLMPQMVLLDDAV